MYKYFLFFLPSVLLPFCMAVAQNGWELKKDKDSIRVFTRTSETSKFNELKVEFSLRGSYGQLRAILEDVENYKSWVYATKTSNLVEKKGTGDLIYYSEIAAPWPISNRDFYSNTRIWIDSSQGALHITSRNVSDSYPHIGHIVRIPYLKADWSVSVLSPGWLRIEYTLGWNPGGSIPAWVANMFSTNGPFQSFSQLKKKMAELNP